MEAYFSENWFSDQYTHQLRLPKLSCDQLMFIQSQMKFVESFDQREPKCSLQQIFFDSSTEKPNLNTSKIQEVKENEQDSSINLLQKDKMNKKVSKSRTGCNCKKSSCLKSYCECYSQKGYCSQDCGCLDCKNNPQNSILIEGLKNKKRVKQNKSIPQCQCKKSKCQKNYCQCYNLGIPCGVYCKCSGCENCQNTSAEAQKNIQNQQGGFNKLNDNQNCREEQL